jgi:hypothetical protein
MRRAVGLVSIVAAVLAATAFAGAPPSSVKATIKDSSSTSRLITIVNGSTRSFPGFFINSTDSPKITATSNTSCKMGTSPWSAKGKSHIDYYANCSAAIPPKKTITVTLSTSGSGPILVWVKSGPHGMQYKIGTGS